jgi:hypothetical protein
MRVDEAIKAKEPFVPVILKYIEDEEENEILATLDNVGLLAKRNTDALASLTQSVEDQLGKVKDKTSQKIKQLTEDLKSNEESVLLPQSDKKVRRKPEPIEEPEDEPEQTFKPDSQEPIEQTFLDTDRLFEGITYLGIPALLPRELADASRAPTDTYCKTDYSEDYYYCVSSGPFEQDQPIGTLGFYTEDHRFTDAYYNSDVFAEYLAELQPNAILTPDFSTYSDWPLVMRLWGLYRARWCGRLWQELGYKLIPSIQSLGHFDYTKELVLETLPDKCPLLSLQTRKSDTEDLVDFIKNCVQVRTPEKFILYGGLEKQKYLHGYLPTKIGRKKIEYIYLPQYTQKRKRLRRS